MLTALSSAMIYGPLPVFMLQVLEIGFVFLAGVDGIAESANTLVKILAGAMSDRLGRRKPVIAFGLSTA